MALTHGVGNLTIINVNNRSIENKTSIQLAVKDSVYMMKRTLRSKSEFALGTGSGIYFMVFDQEEIWFMEDKFETLGKDSKCISSFLEYKLDHFLIAQIQSILLMNRKN